MKTPELDLIAAELASTACSAESPGRSVAALVRHRHSRLSRKDQAAVREKALELLKTKSPSLEDKPKPSWLTLQETAQEQRTTPPTLKRRLRCPEGRRALGWPRWDGHRWLFVAAAIRAETAGEYLATVATEEPWPPDTLPIWVEVA